MNEPYLPALASIEEAIAWLEKHTGEGWSLPRLLDYNLQPWFWLDRSPNSPKEIFGDRTEGFLAPMIFASDTQRLAAERTVALVTMSRTPDGTLFKVNPGMPVPLGELRFKREDLLDTAKRTHAPRETIVDAISPSANEARADASTGPELFVKRKVLIEENAATWPSIETDISDASKNGLDAAKVPGQHGMWYVARAKNWARQRGKLLSAERQEKPPNSVFSIAGRKHTIKG